MKHSIRKAIAALLLGVFSFHLVILLLHRLTLDAANDYAGTLRLVKLLGTIFAQLVGVVAASGKNVIFLHEPHAVYLLNVGEVDDGVVE